MTNYWSETEKKLREEEVEEFNPKLQQFLADKAQHEKEMKELAKVMSLEGTKLVELLNKRKEEIAELKKKYNDANAEAKHFIERTEELGREISNLKKKIEELKLEIRELEYNNRN